MAIEKTAPAAPVRVPFRQDARPVASGGFEAALTAVLGERTMREAPLRVALPREFSTDTPAGQARPDVPPTGQAKAVRPNGPPTARGAIILTPEILLPEIPLHDSPAPATNARPVTPQGPAVARGAIILTPEAPDSPALADGKTGQAAPSSATAASTSATPSSMAEASSPVASSFTAAPAAQATSASMTAATTPAAPSSAAATASTVRETARAVPDYPPGQARTSAPGAFTADEEALLFAAARSVKQPPKRVLPAVTSPLAAPPSEVAARAGADPDSILKTAAAQIGRRYASGGESPRQGFDCSGLTSYVFAKSGLELPRSSREQFRHGQAVKREELKKGDLVFFGKKGVNHVGVYLEDGKFIHAASTGGSVKVGSLDDPVWDKLYAGARRVI